MKLIILCFALAFCNAAKQRSSRSLMFEGVLSVLDYMGIGAEADHWTDDRLVNPEAFMTPAELMKYHGYPHETHSVVTSDGYILDLHRIPYSRLNATSCKSRPPVLVQHGFLSASSTWLINGHRDSLGFVLSDEGYDVWLGNFRGNHFARRHMNLSPDFNRDFWSFGLDEHALIDLPAMIDYVLSKTNRKQLTLIGHSMGATVSLLMLASMPEYNDKVAIAALQAPVIYSRYLKNPVRLLALYSKEFRDLWSFVGSDEVLRSTEFGRSVAQSVCVDRPGVIVCEAILMMVGGYNEELLNEERMHVFFSHFPAGTSFNVIIHLTQMFGAKKPQRFNYGKNANMVKYGQPSPPEYDMGVISAPVAIFWGYMDLYTDQRDLVKLAKQIKSLRLFEMVPFDLWTHQDFQFAKDARTHHYNRLLDVIRGTSGQS